MLHHKSIFYTIIFFVLLGFVITSCKKDKEEPVPVEQTQKASLKLTTVANNKPIDFSSVFTTDAGARYTISSFRYYVSNIILIKNDGSEYLIKDKYLLVNPAVEDYTIGDVPVGDYKGIKFAIGIDSETNHKDPTVYPATNPLAIQSPAIHWSWNSGYIFTMFEGSCDTTANNDDVLTYGQFSHSLFFHIGMDDLYRTVDLSTSSFSVAADSPKEIKIQADLNKLFSNVDLKTENASHTMGSMPLATRVADNSKSMFTLIQ